MNNKDNNANKYLISAAPEMLEALEKSLEALNDLPNGTILGDIALKAIKAAISKAKGE